MKFLGLNLLTALGALLLIRTLGEPLMTEAARTHCPVSWSFWG